MSNTPVRRWRRVVAGTASAALAAGTLAFAAAPASAAEIEVDDAVFAWGLSNESNNAGFAPGTVNFFSAGKISDPGAGGSTLTSATLWSTGAAANWSATDGNVEIQKQTEAGGYATATFDGVKTSPSGTSIAPATSSVFSNHQVTIANGTGTVDPETDSASIAWEGDFTFLGYSGMTFFYVSDPELTVTDGEGTVTATLGGFGTSQDDMDAWAPLADAEVTLATLSDVDVTADGVTVTPDYAGVEYDTDGTPQNRTKEGWGSWPTSFVSYVEATGQAPYWYTSGSSIDANKVPLPLSVSYTAPTVVAPPTVTVSETELSATGEHEITVSGTGFDPSLATATRPPLGPPMTNPARPAGSYVVFGKFLEAWKPSEGAASSARKVIDQKWAVLAEDMNTIGGAAGGAVELKPDGTFTTTLTVSKEAADAVELEDGQVGIYTYPGSGGAAASYETFTPITFVSPAPPAVASKTTVASPAKLVFGRTGKVTATVKAPKAVTGKVQLLDGKRSLGTKAVKSGKATFALPKNLTVGKHALTAKFTSSNSKVVKSSTSAKRNLTVTKVATKTTVKVKKPTTKKKGKATIKVSGTPKAKGKVTLVITSKGAKKRTIRKAVKNGKAVVNLPKAKKKGAYKVSVKFAATKTHKGSKKAVKVKVKK